ncbi:MAG: DinB family protein [Pseudomonadota bacterium]
MIDPAAIQRMAAYSRWANEKLITAVAPLSDQQFRQDMGHFFGSLHHTMNHLIVGDRIWLARFQSEEVPDYTLDQILYEDRDALIHARRVQDERTIQHAHQQTKQTLAETIEYKTVAGDTCRHPLGAIMQGSFNHGTHHRGQMHSMLNQLGAEPPPMDLIFFMREEPDLAAL